MPKKPRKFVIPVMTVLLLFLTPAIYAQPTYDIPDADCSYTFTVDSAKESCPTDGASQAEVTKVRDTVTSLQAQLSVLTRQTTLLFSQLSNLTLTTDNITETIKNVNLERTTDHRTFAQLKGQQESMQNQFSEATAKVRNLLHANTTLPDVLHGPGGAVYTHWGLDSCPGESTLVYAGQAVTSPGTDSGGGGELLCLSPEPEWGRWVVGMQRLTARAAGVVFEDDVLLNNTSAESSMPTAYYSKVICAVCLAQRSSTLMVPGRLTCPHGWAPEYRGYLMTSAADGERTGFTCVDWEAKLGVHVSSDLADNSCQLTHVEASCGVLNCPPYVDHRELTCVVCTK